MATLYTHKDKNIRKTWILMSAFLIAVIGIGWVFAQAFGSPWILYVAVFISIAMNVVAYWKSDKIVIKTSGAKAADEKQYRELHNIVENLSITAGLPKPSVYIVDDPAPNAFATGRNPEHGVVAVTTGLLNILDKNELEGVIAHELSHIGNRDMLVSTVAVVLVGFVALISDIFLRSMFWGGMSGGSGDNKAGVIFIIIGLAMAILAPIVASLIQLAVSRKREFLADASGALLTRYPEGLASALRKIEQAAKPMKKANHATAHLFLSDPFAKTRGVMHKMFMTHPLTEDRIKALGGMK